MTRPYVKLSDLSPQEQEIRRQKHKKHYNRARGCVVCRKPVELIAHKECLSLYERAFDDGYRKAVLEHAQTQSRQSFNDKTI
jgi:hypothetical protein